jgi:arylsulfatase A-like enzyme
MKRLRKTTMLLMLLDSVSVSQGAEKPNILFILADDQTPEAIGAYGHPHMKTPNLDRLAARGVLFNNAYNQGSFAGAVCVASRAMLNTGASVWNAARLCGKSRFNPGGKNMPRVGEQYKIERAKPEAYWSQYMKRAGYEIYLTGKWHVDCPPEEIFDHVVNKRKGMPWQSPTRYTRTFIEGEEDSWSPYDVRMKGYWGKGKHWSEVLADDSIAFFKQAAQKEEPFFMYLAFNAPHDPRQAPKEYIDMYPIEDIEVPGNFLPEYPYGEYAGSGRGLRDEKLAPFPRTKYAVKKNRQEYFALVSHMDTQIGKILDALEASGKADNTYIFFSADHGLSVGDHGFIGK